MEYKLKWVTVFSASLDDNIYDVTTIIISGNVTVKSNIGKLK